jgi:hypothetical protein
VGKWILDHNSFPHVDIYSFTRAGAPWISSSWLAQVLYAEAYELGGWAGPVTLAAAASPRLSLCLHSILGPRVSRDLCVIVVALAALVLSHTASSCASARARAAGHGCLGKRADVGQRTPRGAVVSGCCH